MGFGIGPPRLGPLFVLWLLVSAAGLAFGVLFDLRSIYLVGPLMLAVVGAWVLVDRLQQKGLARKWTVWAEASGWDLVEPWPALVDWVRLSPDTPEQVQIERVLVRRGGGPERVVCAYRGYSGVHPAKFLLVLLSGFFFWIILLVMAFAGSRRMGFGWQRGHIAFTAAGIHGPPVSIGPGMAPEDPLEGVRFESDEFNARFRVTCSDRRFAYDVVHPRMMDFLLRTPGSWSIVQGQAYLTRPGPMAPKQLVSAEGDLRTFVALLPRHLRVKQRGMGAAGPGRAKEAATARSTRRATIVTR